MSQFSTIIHHEITALTRERVFHILLGTFLLMVLISAGIGWKTLDNTNAVYDASVILLRNAGVHSIPVNPVASLPALAVFRNVIIYTFLLGALLALFIGHRSQMRERKSGTLALLHSRPVTPLTLLLGKHTGLAAVLLSVCLASFLMSLATTSILPLGHLTGPEVGKLLVFYLFSFLYLQLFASLGLTFSILISSESLALFIPVGIWVALSFVLPELTTGQTPTALLNPVTLDQSLSQTGIFGILQHVISPFSLGLHYTSLSSQLLDSTLVHSSLPLWQVLQQSFWSIASIIVATCAVIGFSLRILQGRAFPMTDTHE